MLLFRLLRKSLCVLKSTGKHMTLQISDVRRYSCRSLSIAVVSVSIYLFTVSNCSLLSMHVSILADHCASG